MSISELREEGEIQMKRVSLTLASAFILGVTFTVGTPRLQIISDQFSSELKDSKLSATKLPANKFSESRDLSKFLNGAKTSVRLPRDVTNEELKQFNTPSFSKVRAVYFQNCSINKSGLKHLRHSPIEKLFLSGCSVKDNEASAIAALKNLKTLSLNETWVGDKTLEQLKDLPIEKLFLNNTFVGDKGIESLKKLPLKKLYLEGTEITNQALESISRLGVVALNLSNTNVDGGSLNQIKQMISLKKLYLRETAVLSEELQDLPDELELVF